MSKVLYQHTRNDTGAVFYIGIGSTKRAYCNDGRNNHWKRIVEKHGYKVEIIIEDLSCADACSWEKYLIGLYGRKDKGTGILINMTDGGDGILGIIHSDNTKEKMSKSAIGKKVSAVTKEKLRIINTGKKASDETKAKMSKAKKGRKHSTKTILKMKQVQSLRSLEWKNKNGNANKKNIIDINTGVIFNGVQSLATELGRKYAAVSKGLYVNSLKYSQYKYLAA